MVSRAHICIFSAIKVRVPKYKYVDGMLRVHRVTLRILFFSLVFVSFYGGEILH